MTIPQVIDHSIPQLQLLARAAARLQATQALVDLRVAVAGTAGGYGNKGAKSLISGLQKDLKKQMRS